MVEKLIQGDPVSVQIECPQKTFEVTAEKTLKLCLDRSHDSKRCEVAIYGFSPAPDITNIQFQVRLSEDIQSWRHFYTIMQLHGLPDKGEKWRCPILSLDVLDRRLSLYNRWDPQAMSFVTGYNCLEPGSSLRGRTLIEDQKIRSNQWVDVALSAQLSPTNTGWLAYHVAGQSGEVQGGNIYNDQRMPYLKLGIYKPTSWSPQQQKICAEYKDISLTVQKEHTHP